ncbi:MAG: universal stress protein [Methanomicrobiales archaeon]
MYKKILLPTDGSEYAQRAGEHAIWLANQSMADIIVLNVIETAYLQALPEDQLITVLDQGLRAESKRAVEDFEKIIMDRKCDGTCRESMNVKTVIKEGHPVDMILETVDEEKIDLIIMGTAGKHGLDRLLLGSVTEKVVRTSKCPVLVVK